MGFTLEIIRNMAAFSFFVVVMIGMINVDGLLSWNEGGSCTTFYSRVVRTGFGVSSRLSKGILCHGGLCFLVR